MGNYEQLKQAVADVIKSNGNQEITGNILQNALLTIVSTIGANCSFAGIAEPGTNPGTPDQNVFYIASQKGIYSNFNGAVLNDEVLVFTNKNGSWEKYNTGIVTTTSLLESVEELNVKIDKQKEEVEAAKKEALNAIDENEQEAISNFKSQRVTPEMLSESTLQLIQASGGGTITNLADDEDLTSKENDLGVNVLKFADRQFNPVNFIGKGYKILRKNFVEDKNIITQEMINEENTIYEIKYDFDLNETEIELPENCTLFFNGGSLKNGVIKSTCNYVISQFNNPIFIDVVLYSENDNKPFIGCGYDYMTKDTKRTDDILALNNILCFTKSIITKNILNIENWENPYNKKSGYVLYAYDTICLHGNNTKVNFLVNDNEKIFNEPSVWGLPLRVYNWIQCRIYEAQINNLYEHEFCFSNITFIDDNTINAKGSDLKNKISYEGGSYTQRGVLIGLISDLANINLTCNSINVRSRCSLFGATFSNQNKKVEGIAVLNNCNLYCNVFCLELYKTSTSIGAFKNATYNNCIFYCETHCLSNGAVVGDEILNNCIVTTRYLSSPFEIIKGTNYYINSCIVHNASPISYLSDYEGTNIYCYNSIFDIESLEDGSFKGSYYDLYAQGINVYYINCTFNLMNEEKAVTLRDSSNVKNVVFIGNTINYRASLITNNIGEYTTIAIGNIINDASGQLRHVVKLNKYTYVAGNKCNILDFVEPIKLRNINAIYPIYRKEDNVSFNEQYVTSTGQLNKFVNDKALFNPIFKTFTIGLIILIKDNIQQNNKIQMQFSDDLSCEINIGQTSTSVKFTSIEKGYITYFFYSNFLKLGINNVFFTINYEDTSSRGANVICNGSIYNIFNITYNSQKPVFDGEYTFPESISYDLKENMYIRSVFFLPYTYNIDRTIIPKFIQ